MPSLTAAVKASGTWTFGGNPSDSETVTVGAKVYTFQTTLTNSDGNVLIGATAADTITNLVAAIGLGSGAGTLYAAATTRNPYVTASGTSTVVTVTARYAGVEGNEIALAEGTATAVTVSGAALASGSGSFTKGLEEILVGGQLNSDVLSNFDDLFDIPEATNIIS